MSEETDSLHATDNPIAFFCRAKPQYADALRIFMEAKRIFIGYPLLRRGARYNPSALRRCLVDPTCSDEEWRREITGRGSTKSFNQNRNFIPLVARGSIVVIPRPEHGAVYVGRICGPFEIVDSPPWADAYLTLRVEQQVCTDDEESHHIADVAQGWPVDDYKRVDLSRLPGWLRNSMFGQSTFGQFKDHPICWDEMTAHHALSQILDGQSIIRTSWTLELGEIKCRLVDTLNPSAFEHLVVSLLQLENPNEIWHQTGGPGDGGVDGIGSNEDGEIVGLMQAKLTAWSAPELSDRGHFDRPVRRYAAVLVPEKPAPPTDGTILLDLEWIADAVRRHWRALPQARAMRIGSK